MKLLRSKKRIAVVVAFIVVVLVVSSLAYLKYDFDSKQTSFVSLVRNSPEAMQAFQNLSLTTPANAIVMSWWDYGRSIHDFGGRQAVVSNPSRDITWSFDAGQNAIASLEYQVFGSWDSTEKIHDVANALVLPENQSLSLMQKYGASYVMVFHKGDLDVRTGNTGLNDLPKFYAIAKIAGQDWSQYVTPPTTCSTTSSCAYTLTSKAGNVTLLRLLFDDRYPPQHFTKVYDNPVAKIYRINYPTAGGYASYVPFPSASVSSEPLQSQVVGYLWAPKRTV